MAEEKESGTDRQYEEVYKELAQEAPGREVEEPKAPAAGEGQNTLGEAMETAEDLTDLQYAMSKLFPNVVGANSVMIGRIDPSTLLSILHLMSVNEIMQSDPKRSIDVTSIYMNNYVRLTIGVDGRGRIDTAELLGAAREERRADKMLGAGGI